MSIIFFIIAVVVSLPVAAIVLVSIASRREDRRFSLGGPARGRVEQASRWIIDFRTETAADRASVTGASRTATETEPVGAARPRKRIDSPLLATRMVSFRQAA